MSPHVLGLDLGTVRAGAAQLHQDGRIFTWRHDGESLPADAPIADTCHRIRAVTGWAIARATTGTVLAVIEELPRSIGAHGGRDERAAVVWAVAGQLVRHGIPVAFVNPTSLKAKIAGSGRASKSRMRDAVAALYPGQGLARASWDEADAAALATLGVIKLAAHLGPAGGWTGPWLDARALNVDTGCRWPDLGPAAVREPLSPIASPFGTPA